MRCPKRQCDPITQKAATALGLTGKTFKWSAPGELAAVFAAMKADGFQAIIVNPDGWAFTHRAAISELAIANRLPMSAYF